MVAVAGSNVSYRPLVSRVRRYPMTYGTRDIFVGEGSSGGPNRVRLRYGEIPGTGQLHRILINKNLEELRRETLLLDLRRRYRDVKQGRDGLLYLLTDEADAVMLRIEPAE
jgi:glucose/arabinose dehydrogenase